MTSVNSNSKFIAAFKKLLKRRWAGAVVILVLSIAAGIISASSNFASYKYIASDYDLPSYMANEATRVCLDDSLLTFAGFLCFIIGVYSLFACVRYFKEIYKKRSCDYYFSSPIKRAEYFNSGFLFGFIVNAVSFCAGILVYVAISLAPTVPNVTFYYEKDVFLAVFAMLLALLAAFALLLLCAVLAGKKLHYIVLSVIALFSAPTAFIGLAANVNYIWGIIRATYDYAALSPAGNAINAYINSTDTKKLFIFIAISAVEIIGAYIIGLIVFKRRKAEVAEVSLAGKVLPFLFLALLQVSAFMYFGSVASFGIVLGGGLIAAAVVTLIYTAIFYKKAFTKETLITLACTSLACIVVLSSIYLPKNNAFVKYVPDVQEVESVELTTNPVADFSGLPTSIINMLYEAYMVDESDTYTVSGEEGIEKAIALHQRVVSDEVINNSRRSNGLNDALNDDYSDYYYNDFSFEIKYNLKDGRTVARQYSVKSGIISDELAAFFQTEEVIRQLDNFSIPQDKVLFVGVELFDNSDENGEFDYGDYYGWFDIAKATDATAGYADLLEAAIKDKSNENPANYFSSQYFGVNVLSSYYDRYTIGSIMIYYIGEDTAQQFIDKVSAMSWEEFQRYAESDEYSSYIFDSGICETEIGIYSEDTLTLEYLKALGVEMPKSAK